MKERLESHIRPKNETGMRMKGLDEAMKVMKAELRAEEMGKVRALVLYGSTARGDAKETSDIDIHIDLDPYDYGVFKKIVKILQTKFAGMDFSFSANKISEGGRIAKLMTLARNDKPATWKFVYCRSDEEQALLNRILLEAQVLRRASQY